MLVQGRDCLSLHQLKELSMLRDILRNSVFALLPAPISYRINILRNIATSFAFKEMLDHNLRDGQEVIDYFLIPSKKQDRWSDRSICPELA
jgi:hypothetical protein